jgi:lipid-A-disaccharide synthase
VPELLQENATPEALAAAVTTLLTDRAAAAAQRRACAEVRAALAAPGGRAPSEAAAEAILERLEQPGGAC